MDLLFAPDATLPARGRLVFYDVAGGSAPVAAAAALGVATTVDRVRVAVAGADGVAWHERPAAVASVADGLSALVRPRTATASSVTGYVRAARFALGLVAEQHVAPVLRATDDGDGVVATWQAVVPTGGVAADTLRALADALPVTAYALGRDADAVWHPHALLRAFVDGVVDATMRTPVDDHRPSGRPRARLLPWTARWSEAAADPADAAVPLGADRGEILAGVREWLRPYEHRSATDVTVLTLHAPDDPSGAWLLRFGLRDPDGHHRDAAEVWAADGERHGRVEALLAALARAARVSPPIERALDDRQPTMASLDTTAAWRFIDQTAGLLTDAGYRVALPDALEELRPRLQVGTPDDDGRAAGPVPVEWQGVIGGEVVAAETVDAVMAPDEPLVHWQGRWVRVAPRVRAQWADRGRLAPTVPLIEAIGLAVGGVGTGPATAGVATGTDVAAVGPLAQLIDRLRDGPPAVRTDLPPRGFVGSLRAYQRDAVAWLDMMRDLGLGAVLADDMGLGKTVMLIAHLLTGRAGPHLVVCPTSVVTNWERELRRFAPDLPVRRHHGPQRPREISADAGVVVTSYGTLRRDIDVLAAVDWRVAALDEAQQVKNPETLGARAVRRLRAEHCVALTGTPVENRLRELWALLDLTNPGVLGARRPFERRFAHPIERRGDATARAQLRRLVAPFVLRRTKTDPRVAPDLPPRIERSVPCTLTAEQRRLYTDAVAGFRGDAEASGGGMRYRGAVLALLTRLKQICDDPRLGATGAPAVGRSGKLAVTHQLITEATQAGEQVLVFTQFVGMARLLVAELSAALGAPVVLLHGGMSATARQAVVDRFQGRDPTGDVPPVLVASLRAGGTGMNLTAATQVIHYDRWWNPAVEDQASDRAHRIGQTERVLIHRLITVGTVEEHIDAMLRDKRALASAVVGAGETWITELAVDELLSLVALSDDADDVAAAPTAPVVVGRRA